MKVGDFKQNSLRNVQIIRLKINSKYIDDLYHAIFELMKELKFAVLLILMEDMDSTKTIMIKTNVLSILGGKNIFIIHRCDNCWHRIFNIWEYKSNL